jgi:hypothetical protein
MPIDLGNAPTGTPPTAEEKIQILSALGIPDVSTRSGAENLSNKTLVSPAFSGAASGQLDMPAQTASSDGSVMTRSLLESDATRARNTFSMYDDFLTGGITNGIIGRCGWNLAGTGAQYGKSGRYSVLAPATPITSALNCGTLGFVHGDYTGTTGFVSRNVSTPTNFRATARINTTDFSTSRVSAFSFMMAANPSATTIPTRPIQANAIGIASIPVADAVWSANTVVAVGFNTTPATSNGFKYICTTAGTTGATEPTWPTTHGATVTSGTATFVNAGRVGQSKFLFFITGADPLVNITVASSTIDIPTTNTPSTTYYDLSIESTVTGYLFSVNNETPVLIANTSNATLSPAIVVRNDFSLTSGGPILRLRNFGLNGTRI